MITLFLVSLLLSAGAVPAGSGTFDFSVYRTRLLRDEPGKLEIGNFGFRYRSDNGKTAIDLPLAEIREADVSNPREIRIETYDTLKTRLGGHKVLMFRLREGTHDAALGRFLAEHLQRPVIGLYGLSAEAAFEIPAYHKHVVGGSHGVLQIGPAGIQFASKDRKDSRTWLYRDIETIGSANPFHFRITSFAETFNFDLKSRLPEQAYRLAWRSVYGDDKSRSNWTEN